MLVSILVGTALAADGPWLFGKQAIGAGGWPTGLMSDTVVQLRVPLHRSDSIVFQLSQKARDIYPFAPFAQSSQWSRQRRTD